MRTTLPMRPAPPVGARIRFAYREHRELPWIWLEGVVTRASVDLIFVGHYIVSVRDGQWYLA
jgi:hypothetical protein